MILDRLADSEICGKLFPVLRPALEYLRRTDLTSLRPGRVEIDGDRLFAIVVDDEGVGKARAKIEVHRKRIDVQYVLAGEDVMGWRALSDCRQAEGEFDEAKDVGMFGDQPVSWITVPQGSLAVFFTHDGHAPMAGTGRIRKIVMKILAKQ